MRKAGRYLIHSMHSFAFAAGGFVQRFPFQEISRCPTSRPPDPSSENETQTKHQNKKCRVHRNEASRSRIEHPLTSPRHKAFLPLKKKNPKFKKKVKEIHKKKEKTKNKTKAIEMPRSMIRALINHVRCVRPHEVNICGLLEI